ncbi:MAG: hypothetical protein JST16_07440 [Bdellovibrionales bacterium]|nr:hypothetical protein [Bdellovibrionales bacterium]
MNQHTRRRRKSKGQTTLEYIMLMAAAAFMVVSVKKLVLEGMFVKTLPETRDAISGEAASGGSTNPATYYSKSLSVPEAP